MGESKRRKASLGEKYGQEPPVASWIPVTKTQAEQIVKWANRGAWIGIGLLIASWLTVRLIGPLMGWWQVS